MKSAPDELATGVGPKACERPFPVPGRAIELLSAHRPLRLRSRPFAERRTPGRLGARLQDGMADAAKRIRAGGRAGDDPDAQREKCERSHVNAETTPAPPGEES